MAPETISAIREDQNEMETEIRQISLERSTRKLEAMLTKLDSVFHKAKPFVKQSPIEHACEIVANCEKQIVEIESMAKNNSARASFKQCEKIETNLTMKWKELYSTMKGLIAAVTQSDHSSLNTLVLSTGSALQNLVKQISAYASIE